MDENSLTIKAEENELILNKQLAYEDLFYRPVIENLNQPLNFESLSDGAKRVFLMLTYTILARINGYHLIAFEEPENSIHSSLLQSYLSVLSQLAGDCRIIVASHFISWVPFCGLYFRFPSEDFDDLYWDDDYEEGYSVKSWLGSKYTGPYYYGGSSEHYLAAQLAARFFLQENRTVKVGPSFDEYRKGKKGATSRKIEDVSMDAMKMYFAADMDELLERIPVGQLIGLELADSEDLIELVISTAKNFDANLKELDDCLGSKDDKAR